MTGNLEIGPNMHKPLRDVAICCDTSSAVDVYNKAHKTDFLFHFVRLSMCLQGNISSGYRAIGHGGVE